jgi:hypothetical protein
MVDLEKLACIPKPLFSDGFNAKAKIPHGLSVDHIASAMQEFLDFLGFINGQLYTKKLSRLEAFLMPANFSSMVGEFMSASIPKFCKTVAKNTYHNGHPDLVPSGKYPLNSILHASDGIEIKGSRYFKSWQGHNPEDVFLVVFVFSSNRPKDLGEGKSPIPFSFVKVVGAKLSKKDWQYSGRSEASRRTITATVKKEGCAKMEKNWIYRDPDFENKAGETEY